MSTTKLGRASCAVFSLHCMLFSSGVQVAACASLAAAPGRRTLGRDPSNHHFIQCNHATWVLSARAGREPSADRHAGGCGHLQRAKVAAQAAAVAMMGLVGYD